MTIRALLKFRNLDVTKDINDRFADLIDKGVISGGEIVPVSGLLKIDLTPWKVIGIDGLVVEETSDTSRLDTPAGQVTVIAVKIEYLLNNDPIVLVVAEEETAFNSLPDVGKYVVFGKVDLPSSATSVTTGNIDLADRDIIDQVGRNSFRGILSNNGLLPATGNRLADWYLVTENNTVSIWSWNDLDVWENITEAGAIAVDLTNHRQNLFVDEKHLTDDEKVAASGSSGQPVGLTNKFVDEQDSRLPTQDENNALQGSHGTPSNTNRYVTQEFELAVPAELTKTTPTLTYVEVEQADGPYFVGTGGLLTPKQYFSFYDENEDRGYTTSTGDIVVVDGVYTDSALTSLLNPSTDPNVLNGFYYNNSLYLKFSIVPDTNYKVAYGKREIFKNFPLDALLRRTLNDTQVSADTIQTVENIKGREWDDTPPTVETNIELRNQLLAAKQYLSSVFNTDYVVWNFDKVSGIPEYSGLFTPNVGITRNWRYDNSASPIAYSYDSVTGIVTYAGTVPISSTIAGDVFIDGEGNEFVVTATNGVTTVTIQTRDGLTPLSVSTTLADYSGSIRPDDNPMGINLSDQNIVLGVDRVLIREIKGLNGVFHPQTKNVAFAISSANRSSFRDEPRVRLYGGFENLGAGRSARVICTGPGRIYITGYFSELNLLADIQSDSPDIDVYVDNSSAPVSTVSLSRSGRVSDIGNVLDFQQQRVSLVTGLSLDYPHTVELVVGNASGNFMLFGFELSAKTDSSYRALPGRSFVQTDLYQQDTIDTALITPLPTDSRGGVETFYVNRSLVSTRDYHQMTDIDGVTDGPTGTAVAGSSTLTVTGGTTKFQTYYQVGDVVKLVASTEEETKHIQNIAGNVITFTSPITIGGVGVAARIMLLGSTIGRNFDSFREYSRHSIQDFGVGQTEDFLELFTTPSDKTYTLENGYTTLAGNNVLYTTTNIDGKDIALTFAKGITSTLTFRTVCSKLAFVVANSGSSTAEISIDGSEYFVMPFTGEGLRTHTILTNGRYQSHEIRIRDSGLNEIQTLTFNEPPISGNFTLNFDGQPTVPIDWTATAATVEAALEGLPNLTSVTVTGSYAAGFAIEFDGVDGKTDQPLLVVGTNTLAGAGGPITITPLETQQGLEPLVISDVILFEPESPNTIEGLKLATRNAVANYIISLTDDATRTPIGSVMVDPFTYGGVYVNATTSADWSADYSFLSAPDFGRYVFAEDEGSYFEYEFFGYGFELEFVATDDSGKALVYVNGVVANSTNLSGLGANWLSMDSATGTVDMYNSSRVRRKFGISFTVPNTYTIRVEVPEHLAANKNPLSSAWNANILAAYELNNTSIYSVTPSRGFRNDDFAFGINSVRDERNFDSGAITEVETTVTRTVTQQTRSGQVSVASSSIEATVYFSTPFDTNNYTVSVNWVNTTDTYPLYQPIVVTTLGALGTPMSTDGFKVKWNAPLDSGNYVISYVAILNA